MKAFKILLSLLAASLVLFTQTICFAKDKSQPVQDSGRWEHRTSAITKVEEKDYTEEIKTRIEMYKNSYNVVPLETSAGNYLIVTMGLKPTGGYSIELGNVIESESLVTADVLLKSPAPGSIVTQVITYPVIVLKRNTLKAAKLRITENNCTTFVDERIFPALVNDTNTSLLQDFINNHITKRGVYSKKIGNKTYIGVFMGKQKTGGYSIDIVNTRQTGGCWFVDMVFNRPSKDAVVIQAETYPYLVFEKQSSSSKVKVKVKDGLYHRMLLNTMLRCN